MIRRIRIQNFRSLRDVTVDLDPLTVLIGRSGTGKSNFVKAIRTLRDMLLTRTLPEPRTWMPASGRTTANGQFNPRRLSFEIAYGIDGSKIVQLYRIELQSDHHSSTVYSESLIQGEKTIFTESRTANNRIGLTLGSLSDSRESTIAYKYLTQNIGCYDFPGNVLEPSNTIANSGQPYPGYMDRGQNYLPVAKDIFESLNDHFAWKSIEQSVGAINRAAKALRLDQPKNSRLDVGYRFDDGEVWEDVTQESEGLRRYLAHLLALYQEPPKRIAIFEHPEMGIHPGALQALFDEFQNHAGQERGQVILTTHSPEFLNSFKVEQIRVVDIERGETMIGPLAPEQAESVREKWLLPSELFTVDLARLKGQLTEVPA